VSGFFQHLAASLAMRFPRSIAITRIASDAAKYQKLNHSKLQNDFVIGRF